VPNVTLTCDGHSPSVLLLEPNSAVRRALDELLTLENYQVMLCESFEQVMLSATAADSYPVALVAWQCMQGLLSDEHRHHLVQITNRLQLVVMVPRHWKRLLEQSDLGFVHMVAKPFDADELLEALSAAVARSPVAVSGPV